MCGSTMMPSVVQNGCSAGSGSWRNTSSIGAGDALRLHRGDQVGIVDQVAAAEIQQPGGRLHPREALGVR